MQATAPHRHEAGIDFAWNLISNLIIDLTIEVQSERYYRGIFL